MKTRKWIFPVLALLVLLASCSVSVDSTRTEPRPDTLPRAATVNQDDVTLRKCPMYATTPECATITILHTGHPVTIYEYKGTWSRVREEQGGLEGWVNTKRLNR